MAIRKKAQQNTPAPEPATPVFILCNHCRKPEKDQLVPDTMEVCKCSRPTKYTEWLLEKARAYLALKMPNKDTEEVIHSIEGLAEYINVRRQTIYNWLRDPDKAEFLDIVEALLEKQAKTLISQGLPGIFSGPITKLLLAKHGYRDTLDLSSLGKSVVPENPETKLAAKAAIADYLNGPKDELDKT